MNERDMRYMDGRRLPPRNSRGEFMSRGRGRGRGRRGDRGMDYGYDMRGDMAMHYRGQAIDRGDYGDMRGQDYAYNSQHYSDRTRGDSGYHDNRDYAMMGDGHHMGGRGGYEPVEFMGYCSGYYGAPQSDYGRRGDYGYDMRGRRDYGYDYGYPYGDFGETLSEQELESWNKRLMEQLDEREKQMFHKDTIMQKIKQMGKPMEGFGEKELYTATLMSYTDDKEFIGQNPDLAIKLGYAFLSDKDVKVRGAEKLCVYFDEIVMGGED